MDKSETRSGGGRPDEICPERDAVHIRKRSGEEGKSYWFAGAVWGRTDDQLPRFREHGVWENGYEDQFLDLVHRIRPGDQIAIVIPEIDNW